MKEVIQTYATDDITKPIFTDDFFASMTQLLSFFVSCRDQGLILDSNDIVEFIWNSRERYPNPVFHRDGIESRARRLFIAGSTPVVRTLFKDIPTSSPCDDKEKDTKGCQNTYDEKCSEPYDPDDLSVGWYFSTDACHASPPFQVGGRGTSMTMTWVWKESYARNVEELSLQRIRSS